MDIFTHRLTNIHLNHVTSQSIRQKHIEAHTCRHTLAVTVRDRISEKGPWRGK